MKMEGYSLGLLKPDCIQRGLTETILEMVRATGLEIVATRTLTLTKENVEIFYKGYREDDYFDSLLQFMQSGPVIGFIVKGENAIEVLNELVGFTEPSKAKPGTIRAMGIDVCYNLAHSSHSKLDFLREAKVIFCEQLKDIEVL
ncbi:MAG: nucleoside-diphosphate kinase [bacterium]|nr:nucleoside-diphosphate kinase [bacterium]